MKRATRALILLVLFLAATAAAATVSVRQVSTFAQAKNREKTALVQQRLDGTLAMLAELTQCDYIRDPSVSYRDKATLLTNKNKDEGLGYMMIRILDEACNVYREDQDYSNSNLSSRAYLQRLYATGDTQVTDAFLAGADGKTVNYTVASAILEDGKVAGAIFAAIYGTEIDGDLQDDGSVNVLVGSQLQYMGGIPEEQFGLSVPQVLESELDTSESVETILMKFQSKQSGSFWALGNGVQHFAYSPVDFCDWVVMTEVQVLPMVQNVLIAYGCAVAVLAVAAVLLLRKKHPPRKAAA